MGKKTRKKITPEVGVQSLLGPDGTCPPLGELQNYGESPRPRPTVSTQTDGPTESPRAPPVCREARSEMHNTHNGSLKLKLEPTEEAASTGNTR